MKYAEGLIKVSNYSHWLNQKIINSKNGLVNTVDYITLIAEEDGIDKNPEWLNPFHKSSMEILNNKKCILLFILDYNDNPLYFGTTFISETELSSYSFTK